MNLDPSDIVYFQWGFVRITATLVFTWVTMLLLSVSSYVVMRRVEAEGQLSRGKHLLEACIETMQAQIRDVSRQDPGKFLPFIGTLFLFILISNTLGIVPGYISPTGSLNTTIALALCVFLAVPVYGIASQGVGSYLKQYLQPTFIMLPFNIISEITRTLSLAIRLYGNVMSANVIIAILLGIIPLFFPVIIQALGLLTGVIQAYIFAILAIVYIASAVRTEEQKDRNILKEEI